MHDRNSKNDDAGALNIRKKPEPVIWIPRAKRPRDSPPSAPMDLRDRLLQNGESSLTDFELLSLILRETGSTNEPELSAAAFLDQLSGPRGLLSYRPNIERARKLGDEAAAAVMAVMELGDRLWFPVGGKGFVSGTKSLAKRALAASGEVDGNCLGAFLFAPEYRQVGIFEILRQKEPPRQFDAKPLIREMLRKRAVSLTLFCIRTPPVAQTVPEDRDLAAFALATFWPFALDLRNYLLVAGDGSFSVIYQQRGKNEKS